jgi:hypothetical protein
LVLQAQQDLKNGAQFSRVFVNMGCFGMRSGCKGEGAGLPVFHKQGMWIGIALGRRDFFAEGDSPGSGL